MMPFVFNENPRRLLQLSMTGPVGYGGRNDPQDTRLVQTLLNLVPTARGGPTARLAVDGLVGPRTVAAIQRYQASNTRICDGRIDPAGPTIRALISWLNGAGMLPEGLPRLAPAEPRWAQLLGGMPQSQPLPQPRRVPAAAPRPLALRGAAPAAPVARPTPFTATGWGFASSSGVSIGVDVFGATVTNLYLKHDTEPRVDYRLTFVGIGAGLSMMPAGIDFSTADFASYGTQIWYGMNVLLARPRPFAVTAFDGLPTSMLTVGANSSVGVSGALIAFGVPVPHLAAMYFSLFGGQEWGTPNAGITLYTGAIAGWA
jgi:hypothetical protein